MSILRCKYCGGELNFEDKSIEGVVSCKSCGSWQTISIITNNSQIENLYQMANHYRIANEFEKASRTYENILNSNPKEAEAYWGLVLCKFGVTYEFDKKKEEMIPTINRMQKKSIFADEDYKQALKYAKEQQRAIYQADAKKISDIQIEFNKLCNGIEPFDVFICYKQSDENGNPTEDSVIANDLYNKLENLGFNTFFSKVTLRDCLGVSYEPYIFSALHSARVMIVVGTKLEYFNATWVKNEWKRYLSLMENDKNTERYILPAYKNMSPYDMPEELATFQAQDMSLLSSYVDIATNIKRLLGDKNKEEKVVTKEKIIIQNNGVDVDNLNNRGFSFLENEEFDKADECFEKVLNIDFKNARANLGKYLVLNKMIGLKDVSNLRKKITNPYYLRACENSEGEFKEKLSRCNSDILGNCTYDENMEIYKEANALWGSKNYIESINKFAKIVKFKDSAEKIEEIKQELYNLAVNQRETNKFYGAKINFEKLGNYSDAMEQVEITKEMAYKSIMDKIAKIGGKYKKYNLIEEYDYLSWLLERFIDYKDCKELLDKVPALKYETAMKCLKKRDRYIAKELFRQLGNFKDSEKQYKDLCLKENKRSDWGSFIPFIIIGTIGLALIVAELFGLKNGWSVWITNTLIPTIGFKNFFDINALYGIPMYVSAVICFIILIFYLKSGGLDFFEFVLFVLIYGFFILLAFLLGCVIIFLCVRLLIACFGYFVLLLMNQYTMLAVGFIFALIIIFKEKDFILKRFHLLCWSYLLLIIIVTGVCYYIGNEFVNNAISKSNETEIEYEDKDYSLSLVEYI